MTTAAPPKTKKVLYVSTSTTQGGAEKTLYTLATLLDPKQFQVAAVVSLKAKGVFAEKLEAAGHRVYTLGVQDRPRFRHLKDLAEIIAANKPDIVHAIMYQAIQLCRALKGLGYAQFPLVSAPRVHYRTRSGFSLFIDKTLKPYDTMLVTESEASRKYLLEELRYDSAKVSTIYNGVDIASWPVSKADRTRLRAQLRLNPEDVLVGAVGRLDVQKGHRYLIEAVAKLKAAQPVKLAIAGDGPLRRELESLARQLRVEEDVAFLGEVKDVPAWLSAFDVFALPSLWEGLPNAMLEAMAMGLPVVATNVDGVPEILQHDVDGLLCAPKDSQSLFVQLQDLVMDPELRSKLGASAKRAIKERFKLMDMISNYEKLYATLAAGQRALVP
ncbi:MAG: glycosyltransferase [Elusimicrobia bacterium]|nr:glycosyltransferase [Elusimicrobiota bacterium]